MGHLINPRCFRSGYTSVWGSSSNFTCKTANHAFVAFIFKTLIYKFVSLFIRIRLTKCFHKRYPDLLVSHFRSFYLGLMKFKYTGVFVPLKIFEKIRYLKESTEEVFGNFGNFIGIYSYVGSVINFLGFNNSNLMIDVNLLNYSMFILLVRQEVSQRFKETSFLFLRGMLHSSFSSSLKVTSIEEFKSRPSKKKKMDKSVLLDKSCDRLSSSPTFFSFRLKLLKVLQKTYVRRKCKDSFWREAYIYNNIDVEDFRYWNFEFLRKFRKTFKLGILHKIKMKRLRRKRRRKAYLNRIRGRYQKCSKKFKIKRNLLLENRKDPKQKNRFVSSLERRLNKQIYLLIMDFYYSCMGSGFFALKEGFFVKNKIVNFALNFFLSLIKKGTKIFKNNFVFFSKNSVSRKKLLRKHAYHSLLKLYKFNNNRNNISVQKRDVFPRFFFKSFLDKDCKFVSMNLFSKNLKFDITDYLSRFEGNSLVLFNNNLISILGRKFFFLKNFYFFDRFFILCQRLLMRRLIMSYRRLSYLLTFFKRRIFFILKEPFSIFGKFINIKKIFCSLHLIALPNFVSASLVVRHSLIKFLVGFNVKQMVVFLKRSFKFIFRKRLRGYKFCFAGRFTRHQIATYRWEKFCKMSLNNSGASIDFAQGAAKGQFGAFGVKVWMHFR